MDIITKTKKYIKEQDLIAPGDTVIVGVSGGGDSVALLYILHAIRHELGLRLHIAHYNHRLRKSSDADQKFVEQLAKNLDIPCTSASWNRSNRKPKGSLEEKAREQRIIFFLRVAKQKKADSIALAHTEDDLAETVLMRILRGTGLQGLRGILPKRKFESIYFIRPLLRLQRSIIISYLRKNNIAFRVDPTNKQTKFTRNKIRLKLLPLLEKEYNQSTKKLLANLSLGITADYDYLEEQVVTIFNKLSQQTKGSNAIAFELSQLKKQHLAIRRMLIRKAIEHVNGNTNKITLDHSQEAEDLLTHRKTGSIVCLPHKLCIRKDSTQLVIYRE